MIEYNFSLDMRAFNLIQYSLCNNLNNIITDYYHCFCSYNDWSFKWIENNRMWDLYITSDNIRDNMLEKYYDY